MMSAPSPSLCWSPPPSASPASSSASAGANGSVLSRFQYLGFDLDHTLARYTLPSFCPFLFSLLRSHVVSHSGYPSWILQYEFRFQAQHKGLVGDMRHGHFLKLSAKKEVLAAMHGCTSPRMLSQAELERTYPPGALAEFDGGPHQRWHPFYTYFETPAVQLVALMIECTDRGEMRPAHSDPLNPYSHIFPALGAAFEFHLGSSHRGDYFPAFNENPSRFLHERFEVAEWLRTLRAEGKFLFLVTNSRLDYTRLLARYSFGPDWEHLFDLIIADSKKAGFFIPEGYPTPGGPHKPREFYFVDEDKLVADMSGLRGKVEEKDLRVPHSTFIHGNSSQLHRMFRSFESERSLSSSTPFNEPQVIYFGDHLNSDCVATRKYTEWASGAIVEEVEEHHSEGEVQGDDAGSEPRAKQHTFHALHAKILLQHPNIKQKEDHPHDMFGSFFHHQQPPQQQQQTDAVVGTPSPLPSPSSSSSSPPAPTSSIPSSSVTPIPTPDWSYWHHILSQNCEVVVGCLTDLIIQPMETTTTATTGAATTSTEAAPAPTTASTPSSSSFRLNSTCLFPPTIMIFQPPPFGSDFSSVPTGAGEVAEVVNITPAQARSSSSLSSLPAPVQMQYSIHRVPLGMKQELRPIFPELSEGRWRVRVGMGEEATAAAAAVTSSSFSPSAPSLSISDFKLLPLLAIPTFQYSDYDLCHISEETTKEKDRLLESFYAWSKRVCLSLRSLSLWADLVDPCTGYPSIGPHGSGVYSEVDSASMLLSYRMEQVGNCSMIDHPVWQFNQYPATMLTTASVEQIQWAIKKVAEELAMKTTQ